jgi:hypothetical protein
MRGELGRADQYQSDSSTINKLGIDFVLYSAIEVLIVELELSFTSGKVRSEK